jgi:superfamily II DNA or RNA helicase
MKENDCMFLGSKGYTIRKENLDHHELLLIKKELTVKPFVPKMSLHKPRSFPIFRESKTKIYIPRFYGLDTYGTPDSNKLPVGKNIQLEFVGELREYQTNMVNEWMTKTTLNGCGLIEASPGAGKTVIATKLISLLQKKTLIIVHKGFLLRQWKERIEQFLPTARIGRIQGKLIDIENKDIVIGMLQSLSMKDYDKSIFKGFGLTIIDEVHHISAEVFSRVLFKLVTKHMIGLSGTMVRQDGLTPVFKMFMGPIVASWTRGIQKDVHVQSIEYISTNCIFNNIELNYLKQTDYVKMITKLVNFKPRTEFICKVIRDTWIKRKTQILVIGARKTQLTYIYDNIKTRGVATVGYYMGGMKEHELKLSEGKNIIVATYKMAEEGLDIKTLNTIIMLTPKKDVRQSVGRIMRSTGDKLIIDIIDQHANFKRYWTKRRRWYNNQQFKINYTTNLKYDNHEWEHLPHTVGKPNPGQFNSLFGKCVI